MNDGSNATVAKIKSALLRELYNGKQAEHRSRC